MSDSLKTTEDHVPPEIQTFRDIPSLRQWRRQELLSSRTVGFIPTMGALHDGHLSLVRIAALDHPDIVISIFINPAQFGPKEDLDKYPRTFESDLEQLRKLNMELSSTPHPGGPHKKMGTIKAVFHPPVQVLYPSGIPLEVSEQQGTFVHIIPISSKLEGVTRPQFFRGVATVVTKLFNIIQPESAYFGQKDIQQCIVVKKLITDLCFDIDLVVCPTSREKDGLALSSRNVYLGRTRRGYVACLYEALRAAERVYREREERGIYPARKEMYEAAVTVLEPYVTDGRIGVDYISIAGGNNLNEYKDEEVVNKEKGSVVLSGAIRMAPREEGQTVVRVIDNIVLW